MSEQTIQGKVQALKTCFQDKQYDQAEIIMSEIISEYPAYHTPIVLYTQLFEKIEQDNPLYGRILQLSRHYNIWDQFPENLVPEWYLKIKTQNIVLKGKEDVPDTASESISESLPDFGDGENVLEELDQIVTEELVVEEEQIIHLVDPKEIIPYDIDIEISDEPEINGENTFDDIDTLLPDSSPAKEEPEERNEPTFDTDSMFDDEVEIGIDDDMGNLKSISLLQGENRDDLEVETGDAVHPDDEILVASETMAEIFVQQGKISRAVKVYRILMEDDSENFDHYLQRVQELEKLSK